MSINGSSHTASKKKRVRLSPEARRNQLLDSAKAHIQRNGLSGFTMEALSLEAGVSNALVYKYFETRLSLLQELLLREYKRITDTMFTQIRAMENFDELVVRNVELNFDEALSGDIIYILRAQPEVQSVIEEDSQKNLRILGDYLSGSAQRKYKLSSLEAEQVIAVASGASQFGAAHFRRYGGDREAFERKTVDFILAGMEAFGP